MKAQVYPKHSGAASENASTRPTSTGALPPPAPFFFHGVIEAGWALPLPPRTGRARSAAERSVAPAACFAARLVGTSRGPKRRAASAQREPRPREDPGSPIARGRIALRGVRPRPVSAKRDLAAPQSHNRGPRPGRLRRPGLRPLDVPTALAANHARGGRLSPPAQPPKGWLRGGVRRTPPRACFAARAVGSQWRGRKPRRPKGARQGPDRATVARSGPLRTPLHPAPLRRRPTPNFFYGAIKAGRGLCAPRSRPGYRGRRSRASLLLRAILARSGPCAGRLRRPALAAPPRTNDRPRRKSRARAAAFAARAASARSRGHGAGERPQMHRGPRTENRARAGDGEAAGGLLHQEEHRRSGIQLAGANDCAIGMNFAHANRPYSINA